VQIQLTLKKNRAFSLFLVSLSYLAALLLAIAVLRVLSPSASDLAAALYADLAATALIFIFSMLLNNSSVYDPYWSIVPPFIIWYWMENNDKAHSLPLQLLLAVSILWCLRLTLNWARGWKGLQHEDWRYVEFRDRFGPWYWPVSFGGIHLFPTLIVFLGLLPVWYRIQLGGEHVSLLNIAGLGLSLGGTFLELIADEQLRKHRKANESKSPLTSGIWKYSRHPNYLGEIMFWLGLWVFGLDTGEGYVWTIISPLAMTAMFVFVSVPWMEKKVLATRPAYHDYVREVPRLLPLRIRIPGKLFKGKST